MASIATYLQKIKDAIYGEEVRDSIHDAINAMNEEVEGIKSIDVTVDHAELINRTAPSELIFTIGAINYNLPDPTIKNRARTETFFLLHPYDTIYLTNDTYEYRFGTITEPYYKSTNEITWRSSWGTDKYTVRSELAGLYGILVVRKKSSPTSDISAEIAQINASFKYYSAHSNFVNHGLIGVSYGITKIAKCIEAGWYGFKASDAIDLTDLPSGFPNNSGGDIAVYPFSFGTNESTNYVLQVLTDTKLNSYKRIVYMSDPSDPKIYINWHSAENSEFMGKRVAILGDSISTNGNSGMDANVPEMVITSDDVGVTLSAYLTYYDVHNGLSLGGHTFTDSEIGTEVTFTPTSEDVGKPIGVPYNYNGNSVKTWWEVAKEVLGFDVIPVCWSGSSITSHEGTSVSYKTSYAWHEAQIRKCGIRTAGSMKRTAPDMIIIYRGTNDFSHLPYANLTDGYFDSASWDYPTTDLLTNGYGYKEGLCLTIKKLRDAYPNAKIFLCTLNVFKRVNYSHYPTNNGVNTLPQYNNAIREVADFMGCGLIEFDKDGITFENCYSEGYITDNATTPTHPSNKGHKAMGLKAIADLKAQYSNMK